MISVNGKQYYSTIEAADLLNTENRLTGQFLKLMNVEVLRNPTRWVTGTAPGHKYWLRSQVDELASVQARNAAQERICKDIKKLSEEPDEG